MTNLGLVPLASGAEDWSSALAVVMGLVFLGSLALIIVYNRHNRPDLDKDHASHILGQLDSLGGTSGGSVVIRSTAELSDPDRLDDISGLFDGVRSAEPRATAETVTAFKEIANGIREGIRERSPDSPRTPIRALQEAILTLVFGAIVVVPVAVWERAASASGPEAPTVAELFAAGQTLATEGVRLATAFPYSETIFGLATAAGFLTAEFVFTTWFAAPTVLAVLGTMYLVMDRRVDSELELSGPSVAGWTKRLVTLGVTVWLTGTVFATIGGLVPGDLTRLIVWIGMAITAAITHVAFTWWVRDSYPIEKAKDTAVVFVLFAAPANDASSLALAGILAAAVSAWWISNTVHRWKRSISIHGMGAFKLDVIHSLTVTAAALTLPIMLSYIAVSIGTGKIVSVGSVIVSAAPQTLLAVGVLVAVLLAAVAFVFAGRFRGAREGVRRALSVAAVRTVLLKRGFPTLTAVIAAILLLALQQSSNGEIPLAAVVGGALAVGFLARGAVLAFNTVSFKVSQYEGRDSSAARVVISGQTITDAEGEPIRVADVNGHRIAHRDVEPLVGQIARDTRSLLTEGHPQTGSFERYYHVEGVTRGHVDMDSVATELVGDIRTRFVANVKTTDATADEILTKLNSEYPSSAVSRVVKSLKDRGRVTRREDTFLWTGE